MENLDIIILTSFVVVAFLVFIIASVREFIKMEKEEYKYNSKTKKYGRDAIYDLLENLFDSDTTIKSEKIKLFKKIDRTISDMESDGMYFSEEVKEKLEKEREELFCEYSGLPSVKAYQK
jgi:predicted RND superfamily exporter protein